MLSRHCATALGMQHAGMDPVIVGFDAYRDEQTLETTASGYLGGLPLRVLVPREAAAQAATRA